MAGGYSELRNELVSAANGVDYAYRDTGVGEGGLPLVLLGFSIGSFVTQQITLVRPDMVRRLILASSAPQGAAGMQGWAPEVIGAESPPRPRGPLDPIPAAVSPVVR